MEFTERDISVILRWLEEDVVPNEELIEATKEYFEKINIKN